LFAKKEARVRLKAHLPNLFQREDFETKILTSLYPLLQDKTHIISYVADQSLEVDVLPLVDACPLPRPSQFWEFRCRANWYFPKISDADELIFIRPLSWKKGKFGIWEPEGEEQITPEKADIILVPALGYSIEGTRLGRGGGYYDRSLSGEGMKLKTIGFTFSKFFPVPFAPEPHDLRVGKIVTENGMHTFLD
jgi:5-formyltetrahydrofolate cyclo-ligase